MNKPVGFVLIMHTRGKRKFPFQINSTLIGGNAYLTFLYSQKSIEFMYTCFSWCAIKNTQRLSVKWQPAILGSKTY